RDLATHLTRTRALRDGQPLSTVTARLAAELGVAVRILPMSDDPVRTMIRTPGGRLTFQEYFVREKALVEVLGVDYDGAPSAGPVMTDRAQEAALARRVLEVALERRGT